MEHTGPDETHILSKVTCFFLLKSFHFRRLQKQQGFFPKQIPILRKLRNKCRLVSDAHISRLAYLWLQEQLSTRNENNIR